MKQMFIFELCEQGMPDRLLDHLMEDHSTIDPTYVEDYLLTYVIFKNKAHELVGKLLKWFDRGQLKDKVVYNLFLCLVSWNFPLL